MFSHAAEVSEKTNWDWMASLTCLCYRLMAGVAHFETPCCHFSFLAWACSYGSNVPSAAKKARLNAQALFKLLVVSY